MNKKKIVKIIIASSAIAGGIGLSSTLAYASEGKGKVVNVHSGLNVRADAGTQYDVVTNLQNGQEVEICGEVGNWYKVNINGKVGYVSKEYIEKSISSVNNVEINTDSKTGHVVNISSSLNVRQSASTGSAVVGSLRNGQTFNIIGKSGDWYHIQAGGVTGYVSGQYVQEGAGSALVQQAPSQESASAGTGHVVNISSSLNVRQSASTGSAVVGSLRNGQTFNIIGKSGDWYHIQVGGVTGYVSGQYVQEGAGSAPVQQAPSQESASVGTGHVVNISSSLNVRQSASTSSAIVGSLRNGQTFNIIGKSGDWYHIQVGGVTGYVSGQYVQEGAGSAPVQQAPSQESASAGTGHVVNISSSLNVRQSASTSSAIVGSLRNGQTFNIIGKSGSWYHIQAGGVTGYVSGQYVQEGAGSAPVQQAPSQESASAGTGHVVNISSSLNVRQSASTSSAIVGSLRNGQTFNIIGKSGDWYHIQVGGVTGYVSGQYVQEGAGSAPIQQAPSQESASAGTGHVVNISSSLNVRQSASTGSAVVGSLRNGQTFNIIGKSGSWYHIQAGGVTGYVSGQYAQEGAGSNDSTSDNGTQPSSGRGIVVNITSSLRVRSASSTSSSVIGYLRNGQEVNIIGKSSGWVQINFNGRIGFVSADYIRESSGHESSASFQQVLDVMRQHLGSPYVWGGSGEFLTTEGLNALRRTFPVQAAAGLYNRAAQYVNRGLRAFDCSGLMQWGYRQVGISIGRSTWDQINDGREVSLSSLQPGDLLFYSNLQHVGMYIGNGQWIEAPNSSADVRIVSVPWGKIGRARRIL